MPLSKKEWLALEEKAYELRKLTLDTTKWAGSAHIGGGMSVLDMLTIIYHKYLNYKLDDPKWEERDRVVLSKGHAGVAYAALLCDIGWNDKEQLKTFNLTNSKMGMHLDSNKVIGVDASTGSLGHGLPIAAGMGLAARVQGKPYKTFCILGDGECDEGTNWEAAMAIAHYNISNVIAFVDRNGCMIDGKTEDVMRLEPFCDKWTAFGFKVLNIDGGNFKELAEAIEYAYANTEKPVMIVANTKKAEGIDFMEGDYKWHYAGVDEATYEKCKTALDAHYKKRVQRAEREGA